MLFFDPDKIPVPAPISGHSPSQVKTFELCERLWTFQSLHKLRSKPKPNQLLGTAIHDQIENWFLKGIEPPSPLAYAGVQNLPVRGSGLIAIEKPLDKKGPPDKEGKPTRVPALFTGVMPWTGYIDLLYQPLGVTNSVQVWDHKTTTDLMWALSSNDLKTDIQLNTYAKYAFESEPELERVDLFHNYMVTSTMNQTEVRANHVTRAENDVVWKHLETRAQEMQVIADMAVQSNDVNFWQRANPNYDSCSAFGGCAFRDLCDKYKTPVVGASGSLYDAFDSQKQTATTKGEKTMAASDMLKAKIAAAQGKVPTPAASTQVAASAVPAPVAPKSAMAQMLAKKTQAAGAVATGAETPTLTGVLPPDAPKQGPGIAAPASTMPEDLTDDASPAAALASETTETPKKGRGRPKKGSEPLNAPGAPDAVRVAAQAVTLATAERALGLPVGGEDVEATPRGFTLCIGCSPVNGGAAPIALEFVIANLLETAAKQAGIANIHVLDYSKKASFVTELLKSYQFTPSVYTFTTNDNFLEGIIVSVLSTKAALVIRGVR